MPTASNRHPAALTTIKLVHTLVWAFFAVCIVAIPFLAWARRFETAVVLVAIVFVEVTVLAINRWRCPLTLVASRYTDDRKDNFDIFLPLWLARHNKAIFGWIFVAALLFTLARWSRWL
jgi:hypothetical protein